MKIGVLTFWNTQDNYGQILQCYALIKTLRDMGHNAVLIKTEKMPAKTSLCHKFRTLIYSLSNGVFIKSFFRRNTELKRKCPIVNRGFDDFKKKHIPSEDKVYTYEELRRNIAECQVYIVGSDQVWGSLSPMMFLQFVQNGEKKISYAASFGGYKPRDNEEKKTLNFYLKSFELVTVREIDGLEICSEVGIKATLVPDPTLLLNEFDYKTLQKRKDICTSKRPYVLLYLLGNSIDIPVQDIFDFARLNNLDIKYIASQGREDVFGKITPTVEEWLSLYEHASYVITNSFHGTVFSILYKKQFLTILLSGKHSGMNNRVRSLLGLYNMKDRIYTGDLNSVFMPIDYSKADTIRENSESAAKDLLNTHIYG